MNEQEFYLKCKDGKEQAEKSGIEALTRDIELTHRSMTESVEKSIKGGFEEADREITGGFEKLDKDAGNVMADVTKDVVPTRFDSAASGKDLTDNIKAPEENDEIYMSRKRARYQ